MNGNKLGVVLFEDKNWEDLYPLTLGRPAYELRFGIKTFLEKAVYTFGANRLALHARAYLADVVREAHPDFSVNAIPEDWERVIFVNGRLIYDENTVKLLEIQSDAVILNGQGELVGASLGRDRLQRISMKVQNGELIDPSDFDGLQKVEFDAKLFHYLWELVHANGGEIVREYKILGNSGIYGKVFDGAHIIGDDVFIAEGAKIYPSVVLDAEEGPIYIEEGAVIMPNSTIIGPAYIGRNSRIKIGAKIYENVSIGPVCKIGSEVDESIVHSYANKQHDGFLGHAYVAPWVNLGAGTSNSDLKNNYSNVKVFVRKDRKVDTGSMFVGLMIGDHSKAGINTMFNTGTVVGFASNVFGTGFPPKFIPSFAWGGAAGFVEHRIDKAIETARKVMARRKIELTPSYERMMRHIFEMTKPERADFAG